MANFVLENVSFFSNKNIYFKQISDDKCIAVCISAGKESISVVNSISVCYLKNNIASSNKHFEEAKQLVLNIIG